MAGSGAKLGGAILFALGAVITIAAALIVGLGVSDQADNEQQGPLGLGEDGERTEQNLGTIQAGAVAMGLGALFAITGTILIAVGISQRTAEVRSAWRDAQQQHQQVVVATGQGVSDLEAALASQDTEPAPGPHRGPVLAAVAVGLLLVAGILTAAMTTDLGTQILNGGKDDPATYLGNATFDEQVPASFSLMGLANTAPGSSTSHPFDVPAGTRSLLAGIDWTPADGGLDRIQFSIEADDGSGWQELGRLEQGPGGVLTIAAGDLPDGMTLDGIDLRFRAFPMDDGATTGQDYHVEMRYYSTATPPS